VGFTLERLECRFIESGIGKRVRGGRGEWGGGLDYRRDNKKKTVEGLYQVMKARRTREGGPKGGEGELQGLCRRVRDELHF